MKSVLLFIIAVVMSFIAMAQKEGASTLYGYKQKVLPGTVRVDAVGRELPRKPRFNYSIYLVSAKDITPAELWINGVPYTITSNTVSKTPVTRVYVNVNNTIEQVLVPKTNRNVLQLSPLSQKTGSLNEKGKLLSAKNELVLIYQYRKKGYYKTVSKLKDIGSIDMQ